MKYFAYATTLSLATLLHAEDDSKIRNLENRIACLESIEDTCCVINPSARPYSPDCCWGFFVNVDPVIWQARMSGLNIGIQTKDSTSLFSGNRNQVRTMRFDWNWGFRLGLGLNSSHDDWDVLLQWTYWRTCGRGNFSVGQDEAIYPIQGHPARTFSQFCRKMESDWKMRYDLLDLDVGRKFYVSHCLSLRPFGGLRSAWIKQDLDIAYKEIPPNVQNPISPNTQHDVDKSDRFYGIGIRGGLDLQWNLCYGFSIFTNPAASVLYSYHSVKQDEFASGDGCEKTPLFSIQNFYHLGNVIFDEQIGLRFDWTSCNCCYHIGLDLGWELHFHHGQNQFMVFTDSAMDGKFVSNQGDLNVQGYFLKVRFDF